MVLPDTFDVKLFGHVLREQFVGLFRFFLANQDFDSAYEIGVEPIQPDHFWQISIAADHHRTWQFNPSGGFFRKVHSPPGHLGA